MTEEIKNEKCCISKEYKNFLSTLLASILGCLVALCLYNASTRCQCPPPIIQGPCPLTKMEAPNFQHPKGHHKHFKGEWPKPQFDQKPPVTP